MMIYEKFVYCPDSSSIVIVFVSDRLFLFAVLTRQGSKSAKMEYTVAPASPGEKQWVFFKAVSMTRAGAGEREKK